MSARNDEHNVQAAEASSQVSGELSDDALEGVSGGLLLRSDADTTQRKKKGNVEYSWKVEEGES